MGVIAQLWYSCVHNQIATFGLLGRQSVTLNIGLNVGCSHNRNNRPSEQSAKCNIGLALHSSINWWGTLNQGQFQWSHFAVTRLVRNQARKWSNVFYNLWEEETFKKLIGPMQNPAKANFQTKILSNPTKYLTSDITNSKTCLKLMLCNKIGEWWFKAIVDKFWHCSDSLLNWNMQLWNKKLGPGSKWISVLIVPRKHPSGHTTEGN